MRHPDSFLSRLRRFAAAKLEPLPDEGEGWCLRCSLNKGRTAIISESGVMQHVEQHPAGTSFKILTN